jgi:hypothetical protein
MSVGLSWIQSANWIDGKAFWPRIEPYRQRLFAAAFARDDEGRATYNMLLAGRAKKNWKSADLMLTALGALLDESPGGSECFCFANDEGQAGDDLSLAKKIVLANPMIAEMVTLKDREIMRKDGRGFLRILPAMDIRGSHGKTYRLCAFDEIHGYRTWDLLEAMALDPSRPDAQQVITSYASLYHKPGVPLYDLMALGKAGSDPRFHFSWYGADFTTDPDFTDATPEQRANPSMAGWPDQNYLAQQARRLPAHKYRRLHLNLPGLPEGSAFQPEPVMNSIERGVKVRLPEAGHLYKAFVDMSGGSNDDATLSLAHEDDLGRVYVDCVMNQGGPPPFNPALAVSRFAEILLDYGCASVTGDAYGGETFKSAFATNNISYRIAALNRSELYEAMEPLLNAGRLILPDIPILEQQLLGLVWRGGKIDHLNGEHDDWANACAGACALFARPAPRPMPYFAQSVTDTEFEEAYARLQAEQPPANPLRPKKEPIW